MTADMYYHKSAATPIDII